jgi:hypothetical protein
MFTEYFAISGIYYTSLNSKHLRRDTGEKPIAPRRFLDFVVALAPTAFGMTDG